MFKIDFSNKPVDFLLLKVKNIHEKTILVQGIYTDVQFLSKEFWKLLERAGQKSITKARAQNMANTSKYVIMDEIVFPEKEFSAKSNSFFTKINI